MQVHTSATQEPPVSTINDFIPEHRDLSECISSIPKPDCGSPAKEDWAQGVLLAALVLALTFIGWRIVRVARRARPERRTDEHV